MKPLLGRSSAEYEVTFVRIAVYPLASGNNVSENFSAIRRGIHAAHQQGVRLLVFQECALSGYPPVEVEEIEEIDFKKIDSSFQELMVLAKEAEMYIALGTVRSSGEAYRNAIVLFGPTGDIVTIYDKRALWGWDKDNFETGDSNGIISIDGISVGFRICYEIRFPEYFREMFSAGVSLCFVSFCDVARESDLERYEIIKAHLITRAAENVMTVVSVNSISKCQTAPTAVFSPDGRVILEVKDQEEMLLVYDYEIPDRSFSGEGREQISRDMISTNVAR